MPEPLPSWKTQIIAPNVADSDRTFSTIALMRHEHRSEHQEQQHEGRHHDDGRARTAVVRAIADLASISWAVAPPTDVAPVGRSRCPGSSDQPLALVGHRLDVGHDAEPGVAAGVGTVTSDAWDRPRTFWPSMKRPVGASTRLTPSSAETVDGVPVDGARRAVGRASLATVHTIGKAAASFGGELGRESVGGLARCGRTRAAPAGRACAKATRRNGAPRNSRKATTTTEITIGRFITVIASRCQKPSPTSGVGSRCRRHSLKRVDPPPEHLEERREREHARHRRDERDADPGPCEGPQEVEREDEERRERHADGERRHGDGPTGGLDGAHDGGVDRPSIIRPPPLLGSGPQLLAEPGHDERASSRSRGRGPSP